MQLVGLDEKLAVTGTLALALATTFWPQGGRKGLCMQGFHRREAVALRITVREPSATNASESRGDSRGAGTAQKRAAQLSRLGGGF